MAVGSHVNTCCSCTHLDVAEVHSLCMCVINQPVHRM